MEIMILFNFSIAETKSFQKAKLRINQKVYEKIVSIVYPQLKANPFYGNNIKKLKGEFEGFYRYRIGDYRLFYVIENEKVLVIISAYKHRKEAY